MAGIIAAVRSSAHVLDDDDAAPELRGSMAAEAAFLKRRREVWQCLACQPGWAQAAAIRMVIFSLEGTRGGVSCERDLAFALWCACPMGAYDADTDQASCEPEEECADEDAVDVAATKRWLCTTASAVGAMAVSGLPPADAHAAGAFLTARVAEWLAPPAAHAGLTWQCVFAATCVAIEPTRWVNAAVDAVLPAVDGTDSTKCVDEATASRAMEWMWHLLTYALAEPPAPDGEAQTEATGRAWDIAEAASAGAALVAARRPEDADLAESARLLREAAGSGFRSL